MTQKEFKTKLKNKEFDTIQKFYLALRSVEFINEKVIENF